MTDTHDNAKVELVIHGADPAATVYALRHLLASAGVLLFDRGDVLVCLRTNVRGLKRTKEMTVSNIVMLTHDLCQPVKIDKDGNWQPTALPDRIARMYLEFEEWNLPELGGISTAPIMREDGSILLDSGYDAATQIYCDAPPRVTIPARPTKEQAQQALMRLRRAFRTFPFADAQLVKEGEIAVIDLAKPPGLYESSCLAALLTAIIRPSLWLVPGWLITAQKASGSGSGKGLLGRAITIIAYGINPRSFTKGHDRDEFDKRVVAALLTGAPVVFIDNINDALLISDTLASVLTERPSQVRVLGYSNMLEINSAAFIILTGNALKVTMDLTRRFIWTDIDARVDNPERRPFPPGFLESIRNRRGQLLAACLTILRYGRVNAGQLGRGLPVGSFEAWAEWVRDPLLALGCQDVVEGMQFAKEIDPERQEIAELYTVWHHHHNGEGVTIKDLHGDVLAILNPLKRSRQFLMRAVEKYVNTRHAGFVLLRSKGSKWSPAIYQLQVTDPYNPYKPNGDLDYRGRQPIDKAAANPITPITPILFESEPRMGDTPDTGSDKSERLVSMFRSKIKFNTRRLREQPTEDR